MNPMHTSHFMSFYFFNKIYGYAVLVMYKVQLIGWRKACKKTKYAHYENYRIKIKARFGYRSQDWFF